MAARVEDRNCGHRGMGALTTQRTTGTISDSAANQPEIAGSQGIPRFDRSRCSLRLCLIKSMPSGFDMS